MIGFWNIFYKFAGNLTLSVTDEYEKAHEKCKDYDSKEY